MDKYFKAMTVGELKEILEDIPEYDYVVPNKLGNLLVFDLSEKNVAYIDFLTRSIETIYQENFELEQYIDNLKSLADDLGGSLEDVTFNPYIRIDTGDNTSKDNFDDLIHIVSELPDIPGWKVKDYWVDHDTQIIEFTQR